MSNFRKYAWFQLAVCGLTALAVLALYLATGNWQVAMAGFAMLSLSGFAELYFRTPDRRPCQDERDEENSRRAIVVAHMVFWVCFVLYVTGVSLRFSQEGQIPLQLVSPMVFTAWWLVVGSRSTVALVLDQRQN